MKEKILLVQVAALGYNLFTAKNGAKTFDGLEINPIEGLFPALTCPVQATLRTATLPSLHGIIANGFFVKEFLRPFFWEQSSSLIKAERIWKSFRAKGGKVAEMFIQQSLGSENDIVLSPAPIHKHHGGMILNCFSKPAELNKRLKKVLGKEFPLQSYWGPFAGEASSLWIVAAVKSVVKNEKPDLLYTYIPHLDYDLQRFGPDSKQATAAFKFVKKCLISLLSTAKNENYKVIIFGDYPITPAKKVIYPNKILKAAGLFKTRNVRGMQYPDLFTSVAFAVVDHQIAHVHIFDSKEARRVRGTFEKTGVIAEIIDGKNGESGIENERSGDLVLLAEKGSWFDYRWWDKKKEAPEYASHVDIHNKPGYDPCELFRSINPFKIGNNPDKVRGTHGRNDKDDPVFYMSDIELPGKPGSLLDLSKSIQKLLDTDN
ncbi:MAG TPA: nucleotide pyrophosphatase/phosphodiesterase family protein [Candidatus Brocadiaceae bacterium]